MRACHQLLAVSVLAPSILAGCATPLDKPISDAPALGILPAVAVTDLRAAEWKATRVVQNAQGVVQHLGDDRFPGGSLPAYLTQRLARTLASVKAQSVTVKTTDIRLSIPGAKLDEAQVATAVATSGPIAAPILALMSTTTQNKAASAVFCVSVDGRDFLGNDARLFRYGPEGEMRQSIDAAIAILERNIAGSTTTASVACEAGWEGGQPRR